MQILTPNVRKAPGAWPSSQGMDSLGQVDIEFTSDCNLRCVYCPVSSKTYHGTTMPAWLIEKLKDEFLDKNIRHVGINGHGETTAIEGWMEACLPFLETMPDSHLITNSARVFDQAELEVLARVKLLIVSLDTVDPQLLKEVRRRVDLRNVVMNIANVRATALRMGIEAPRFQINAGIYDRSIFGLPDLARFCAAMKIETVSFWSLVVHSVFVDDVQCDTVEALSAADLRRGVQAIDETLEILRRHDIACIIPGDFISSIKQIADQKEALAHVAV